MRRIYLFYLKKPPSLEFLNSKKNSLFISDIKNIENKDCFITNFKSYFNNDVEKIEIHLFNLLNDDSLTTSIDKLIKHAYLRAKQLSKENMPPLSCEIFHSIKSTFYGALLKCKHDKYIDIFHFVADIFYKINVTHKLGNGNKRLATSTLITLLYSFGYYFKFSSSTNYETEDWEEKCKYLIEGSSNKIPDEKLILDARKWIIDNIVISLNFSD